MNLKFIDDYINSKLSENEDFIRFTYYELKVKSDLSEQDIKMFLNLAKTKFQNIGYNVFFTGEPYMYKNEVKIVEKNEFMIAIKL